MTLAVSSLLIALSAQAGTGKVGSDCTLNGHQLWGRVQVVKSFADIDVEVVDSFADLRVQEVENFPDACGKWQFVKSFPDIKVRFVDS